MSEVMDLAAELSSAKRELKRLKAQVARNEEKMRKSQARELRLLNSTNLDSLFREMCSGLRKSYGLTASSLVLADPDHDVRHLMAAAGTPAGDIEGLMLVESLTGLAPQYVALRQPWLGAFQACDHQLLLPDMRPPGSVAIIPLTFRGNLIGSLNFGSDDPDRFRRDLASDLLAHLGVIASFCIENSVNRARLFRSGFTDVLTGWHNRRYLIARLKEELARARRDGTRLVCLMLDIDHFKRINDTWGHPAGDAALVELAHRIDGQVRKSDVAARYGGEEFVVLMPDTDTASAERLAARIREVIAASPVELPGGEQVTITTSIGISAAEPGTIGADLKNEGDALLARADVALYRAKSKGRDRVEVEAP
ncbi:MAG: sensor domain-containing diguanylate cyclase [Woeseiaceae bacterium]|nr:sensor domain-containing diguanylate cyclase [Woeseiaceae bacterium]